MRPKQTHRQKRLVAAKGSGGRVGAGVSRCKLL